VGCAHLGLGEWVCGVRAGVDPGGMRALGWGR